MIKDQPFRDSMVNGIRGVRDIQQTLSAHGGAAVGGFGIAFLNRVVDAGNNLALIYAYSILGETLQKLCEEKHFSSRSHLLGNLMKDSKKALPWVGFALVDEGRERRNGVAHHLAFLERKDCWRYIDAIERELIAWKILPGNPLQSGV